MQEEIYVWDGINNTLEEFDSLDGAKEFINETFCDSGDIHPDIESVFILKKIASVYVHETDKTTELNGDIVPVCNVIIK